MKAPKQVTKKEVDAFIRWFETGKGRYRHGDAFDRLSGAKDRLTDELRHVPKWKLVLRNGVDRATHCIYSAIWGGACRLTKSDRALFRVHNMLRPFETASHKLRYILGNNPKQQHDDELFKPADFLIKGTNGKSIFDTYLDVGADGARAILQGFVIAGDDKLAGLYSIVDDNSWARLKQLSAEDTNKNEYLIGLHNERIAMGEACRAVKANQK